MHTVADGQSSSFVHEMLLQPELIAWTGTPVGAGPHAWWAGHVAPSSQRSGRHAPSAPQTKPAPQVVAVHGGAQLDPTPSELHPSAIA